MSKVTLVVFFTFFASMCFSQGVISGKVKDNKGRPISGASIAIKDTYDGGTSDTTGNFRFRTLEKGEQVLLISSIGYKLSEQKINIAGSNVQLNIVLREEPNELTAVVITAGTFEASDTKRTTVLNPIDIVTTASANADVTEAIKTLPGAQQVGESEGLFVRGGTAQETKVFIDGTLVNNFYFSNVPDLAQRGRFSPFLFKGTIFSSGGYSALYGQALSSALILESIDLPDQSSANVGISTVGLSGGYQHLNKKKTASWGIGYDYTDLTVYFAVVKQNIDHSRVPAFHNGEFNFRVKTSKTGMLKYYGYFNLSNLGIRRPDIDSLDLKDAFVLKNFNLYQNLSWKEKIGQKWKLYVGISHSTNTDKIANELQDQLNQRVEFNYEPYASKNFDVKATADLSQIKAVFERRLSGLSAIRFGGEYLYFKDRNDFSNTYINGAVTKVEDHFKAAFAETDIYITNDLAAKIGSRLEHSSVLGKVNIVPRISLAYKVGDKAQASLAYGIFYQKPEKEFYLRNYIFNNLLYTKATHYIANYQKVSRQHTFRVEGFYKKYDNLLKTYSTATGNPQDSVANTGYGKATGIELFWRDRKTLKNVDYWVSYSYLDTKRDYLNYPYSIRPNFAATHTGNLVVKKFVSTLKTQFNGSYTFASGRSYYDIRLDNDGKSKIVDQGKTIAYHNLSFSVNYLPNIGSQTAKKFTVVVFSVTNVLGSKQVFGYNYSYDGNRKQPIVPEARRFFFLGCFMSFGVDRTEDNININL